MSISQIRLQGFEPAQLSPKIGMADVLTIGAIHCNKSQVSKLNLYQSSSQCLLPRKSPGHSPGTFPAQDCDPVPGFLTFHDGRIPLGLEDVKGELLLIEFELLQSNDVGLPRSKPVEHEVKTGPQSVNVPGCDAHAQQVTG